jgi:N utilization substance protein A
MTQEELAQAIDRAVGGFSSLTGVEVELAERLVEEGFLSYDDLSIIEPDALMSMGGLSEEEAAVIVEQAEGRAEQAEAQAAEARRHKREQERLSEMAAEAGMTLAPEGEPASADGGENSVSDAEASAETAEIEEATFDMPEATNENGSPGDVEQEANAADEEHHEA